MVYADLHCHTILSDGKLTPKELLDYASSKSSSGLEVIALNDHDFMHQNFKELDSYAGHLGIHIISGIELTATYSTTDLEGKRIDIKTDILLYEPKDLALIERHSNGVKEMRQDWMRRLIDHLNHIEGWHICAEEVFAQSPSGYLNRRHLRDVIIKQDIVKDHKEGKLYTDAQNVPKKGQEITTQEGVKLGKDSGAVVGFAHPFEALRSTLGKSFTFDCATDYIKRICNDVAGIDVIETYYPTHSEREVQFCQQLASEHGFIISGGSDFHKHGEIKPNGDGKEIQIDLGCTGLSKEEFGIFDEFLKVKN